MSENTEKTNLQETMSEIVTEVKTEQQNVNHETGAITIMQKIDDTLMLVKDENGKFRKMRIFPYYSSITPETQEQKINFYKMFVENDNVKNMSEHTDKVLDVVGVVREPYESIDENTGAISYGVTTKLLTKENIVFATSSKSVAMKTEDFQHLLGEPSEDNVWRIKIIKKKSEVSRYSYIDIVLG